MSTRRVATIGGISAGSGNVISGNSLSGISIAASCLVEGNEIGTTPSGSAAVPNRFDGVLCYAPGATIGGSTVGAANVISGNLGDGIDIDEPCLVEGNDVGADRTGAIPVPNQGIGVYLYAGSAVATTIGAAGAGNLIAFNVGPGVATAPGTTGSTIRFNAIFGNGGPGIDRNDDGVTPNTANGPNNTPVLMSMGDATIAGTLNASPNSTYIIDFYADLTSDASTASPQGRDDLAATTVVTNVAGDAVFNVPYTPVPGVLIYTATATDTAGTTSEFSPPWGFVLTATGVSLAATTGVPSQETVAGFNCDDPSATAADFTATINYGDSTASAPGTVVMAPGGFVVTGTHTYEAANPADPVTVTITDTRGFGQATANSLVDVTNPGGVLTPFGQSATFVAGTLYSAVVASFTDSSPLAVPGEFTATINWGDGTTANPDITSGTIAISGGGFNVTGSHTYDIAGTYDATVTITDDLTMDSVTAATTVAVAPIPITLQTENFAVTGGVSSTEVVATFTGGYANAGAAFYTATINWGDAPAGSPPDLTMGTIGGTNSFTVTASHTFAKFKGTDLVTITITDEAGRTATGVDLVVDPPVVSEPEPTTTNTPPEPTAPTNPAEPLAPATTPAVLAITAVPLTLSRHKPFQGIVATFTDSGPPQSTSDYTAMINWGKGRKSAGMITGSNGRFIVSARHVFPRFSGEKEVTVTVSDTEGQVVSVSGSATDAARHPKVIKVTNRAKGAMKFHR